MGFDTPVPRLFFCSEYAEEELAFRWEILLSPLIKSKGSDNSSKFTFLDNLLYSNINNKLKEFKYDEEKSSRHYN